MMKRLRASGATLTVVAVLAPSLRAASLNGSAMAFQSSGTASSTDWLLSTNGYVGTYITLASPGQVTLSVQASGNAGTAAAPLMGISVDNTHQQFFVTPGFTTYTETLSLPAGTHFVRTDFYNDITGAGQSLTVRNLSVTGASLLNANTDANALAAADTYAANYRKGTVSVTLPGVAPGTPVEFKMIRNAFDFEGSATGSSSADSTAYMAVANPAVGSTAYNYQKYFNANFNTLEPANAGKWSNNEPTQNHTTMSYVDTLLNYAQTNNLNVRMHNLIWGVQQPTWVNTLLTNAQSTNPTTAATAKAALSAAILNRINYYVGATGDRSDKYVELDGLNEALRTDPYWKIFGAAGIAQIYNEAAHAAVAAGNPTLHIYTNEYNVLEFSTNPTTSASDPYANWYRQNIEDIQNALPGQPTVSGVGIQYYADSALSNHSAGRILAAVQNLSVTGLPISLTEFNVKNGATAATTSQILTETMRMMYGSPNATTFGLWDFWAGAASGSYTAAVLYDANWNLTPVGVAYQNLLNQWSTDATTTVGLDGAATFTGTYGEYQVLIGGQTYSLTIDNGTPTYTLFTPEPASLVMLVGGAALGLFRRRRRCD